MHDGRWGGVGYSIENNQGGHYTVKFERVRILLLKCTVQVICQFCGADGYSTGIRLIF